MSYRRHGAGRWNRATDAAVNAGLRAETTATRPLDQFVCHECAQASVETYPRTVWCEHGSGYEYSDGRAWRPLPQTGPGSAVSATATRRQGGG